VVKPYEMDWEHDYYDESYQCEDCTNPYPHLHIIPMREILRYESCDRASALGETCILDVIIRKRSDSYQIDSLRELIESEGFRMGYGIAVIHGREFIHDGHHRLTVLFDMGAQWCPVQTRSTHAMDTPEYSSSKSARVEASRNSVPSVLSQLREES